jgi:hypothetical protein
MVLIDKLTIFCLISLAILSLSFVAWTIYYRYTCPDYMNPNETVSSPYKDKPKTRIFIVKTKRMKDVLDLKIDGMVYFCNPDDYQLLTSLGITFDLITKVPEISKGEVVLIVDNDAL